MNIETMNNITRPLDEEQARYKLHTWFSPAYPIGSYTYSHGLEAAVEAGLISGVDDGIFWIGEIITNGNGFSDAVFLNAAHNGVVADDFDRVLSVIELAVAFCGSKELRLESCSQGLAFMETRRKVDPSKGLEQLQDQWAGPYPYCVVCGIAAGELGIDVRQVLLAYLHGTVANLSSALVRIIPLGQSDGQTIIEALADIVSASVERAIVTEPDDLSVSTLMVDLMSMQHETQYTRLFRS